MASMQQPQHQQRSSTDTSWDGYEWNIPLDELIDCNKCPQSCQTCYYKLKYAPIFVKTILVILFLAVIIALVSFLFRFGIYNSKQYTMGAGDQRLLANEHENYEDFSRLFCKAFQVETNSEQVIDTYVFTSKPKFLNRMETFDIIDSVLVGYNLFPSWGYHLNANGPSPDRVTIETCSGYPMDFHFFNDKSDWKKFINSKGTCEECVYQTCHFNTCGTPQHSCVFTAPKTTTIYMTLVSYIGSLEVQIRFEFRRGRFDLSQAELSCNGQPDCKTNLPLDTEAIVLTLPTNATLNPSQLTTDCIPCVSIYFAFFGAIPLGLCIVVGAFGLLLMKLQDSVMKDVEQADRQREYRQMGYRTDSSISPSVTDSVEGETSSGIPQSPPPAYPVRVTRSIFSTSRDSPRDSLVENEQPVGSLPDYDTVKTIINTATEDLPSYGSLNNNI